MQKSAVKTVNEYLEMDGCIIFNIAIFKKFSSIGDSCYSEICGGFIEGVYQWADHNISYVQESENHKYVGYTINFEGGAIRRVYIEKWVLNVVPKDFKHAQNLFAKYLRSDEKFNNSEEANYTYY